MSMTMYASHQADHTSLRTRLIPLAAIIVAHLCLFYALQQGLTTKMVHMLPKEVIISLIQPLQAAPKPPAQIAPAPAPLPKQLHVPQAFIAPAPEVMTTPLQATPENTIPITPPTPATSTIATLTSTPAAPPAPISNTLPKLVSGVEYLQAPQAEYPALARRMGEEGKVTLRVLVNEKGRAEKVEIQKSSGFNRLDEAARVAVMRALFKPYIEDGKPFMMLATATISFSLSS